MEEQKLILTFNPHIKYYDFLYNMLSWDYTLIIIRLKMMLRWLIRDDKAGVDFRLWKNISPSILSCALDVHSGNVARKLGLIIRNQNDAKALFELDTSLRTLDPINPVKYDFAIFGLGVFESF